MTEENYQDVINELFKAFKETIKTLNNIENNIEKLEKTGENVDALEHYYAREFSECVSHADIYEELNKYIVKYEKDYPIQNIFRTRIEQEAKKLLKVLVVDL